MNRREIPNRAFSDLSAAVWRVFDYEFDHGFSSDQFGEFARRLDTPEAIDVLRTVNSSPPGRLYFSLLPRCVSLISDDALLPELCQLLGQLDPYAVIQLQDRLAGLPVQTNVAVVRAYLGLPWEGNPARGMGFEMADLWAPSAPTRASVTFVDEYLELAKEVEAAARRVTAGDLDELCESGGWGLHSGQLIWLLYPLPPDATKRCFSVVFPKLNDSSMIQFADLIGRLSFADQSFLEPAVLAEIDRCPGLGDNYVSARLLFRTRRHLGAERRLVLRALSSTEPDVQELTGEWEL